jgi:outer membrane protein assembly factor BamB
MKLVRLLTLGILLGFTISCTKTLPDKPNIPPVSDANGILYVNVVGYFIKLDASTDSVNWWGQTMNLFNSSGNPITFDGDNFYHGNATGLTGYSTSSGSPLWEASWLAFDNAIPYQEPAFNDSLIFYAAPTSYWDYGYLHCRNTLTGALHWQIQLDSGDIETNFTGTPEVYNDKVFLLTRNHNNQKILKAFSISDGSVQWAVQVNDSTPSKFRVDNGRIYSAYGPTIFCLDAATGHTIWNTDVNVPSCWWTYDFMDGDRQIIVKVMDNVNYKVIIIQKSSGAVIGRQDLEVPTTLITNNAKIVPIGCAYRNNSLVIANFNTIDSMDIHSYDINTMSQKWTKRIANSIVCGGAPVLTDNYIIFPINLQYNTAVDKNSEFIFLDYSGNKVKELPFHSLYTDGFVYVENGQVYTNSYHH